jgi:hypothetical protein
MTTPVQNGELINDIRLLNADVLVSGTVAAFSSGLVAGRNTIIITLDGTAPVPVGELFCVISRAEALDLPSVVLAPVVSTASSRARARRPFGTCTCW